MVMAGDAGWDASEWTTDAHAADHTAQTRRTTRMAPFRELDDPASRPCRVADADAAPWIRRRNLCEFDDPIKRHRNISARLQCAVKTMRIRSYAYPMFRIAGAAAQTISISAISPTTRMRYLFYGHFSRSFDSDLPCRIF
jgi:hypothetical protein